MERGNIKEMIKNLSTAKKLLKKIENAELAECDKIRGVCLFIPAGGYEVVLRLDATCFKGLEQARQLMRKILGSWEDKIEGVFYPNGVIYNGTGNHRIIVFYKDGLPDSITKNGKCKFVKQTWTTNTFVCERGE